MIVKAFIYSLAVIFASLIHAQTAEEVLKRTQDKYDSIEDFSADFIQYTDGGSPRISGKFFYKKSDKFRLQLDNQVIVSDGETFWNFDKRLNRVVINLLENDPSSFSISSIVYDYPKKCRLMLLDGGSGQSESLLLIPQTDELGFASAKLSISGEGLINKFELTDGMGNRFIFELDNIKINTGLKESNFEFYPPEGIDIIDLR